MAVGQRLVEKGRGEVAFVSGRDYANAGFNWCLHPDLALHGELRASLQEQAEQGVIHTQPPPKVRTFMAV